MPQSKHRRGGQKRPRHYETHAPERNAATSPTWVPATGASLLVLGVLVILVGYLPPVSEAMSSWVVLGSNWGLVGGFVLLIAGFVFLSRWR
jgi:hypothetical protein